MTHSPIARTASFAFAALLVSAALLHADVTTVAWYTLGDNDLGAAAGQTVKSTTADLLGLHPLNRVGSPQYTGATSTAAAGQLDSSLAVTFSGSGQAYTNTVFTAARDNFGIEAWVQPGIVNAGSYFIAYNGDATTNGWGLCRNGNTCSGFINNRNGPVSVGSATAVAGHWAHVALVRDSGTSTFYVNGVATGTDTTTPGTPNGAFALAAAWEGTQFGGLWPGAIDEVRVFTFTAGQFTTADLLYNQRRAQTLAPTALAPMTATLNGSSSSFGSATTVWFEWGLATNAGTTLTTPQSLGGAFNTTNFSQAITGLGANTYYYRAIATNSLGVAYGNWLSFTLGPVVTTLPPNLFASNSATLVGTLGALDTNNPGLTATWFDWGTTTNYGNRTPVQHYGDCTCTETLNWVLTGLTGGVLYHYRALASNTFGLSAGADQTFGFPVTQPVLFMGGLVSGTNLQLTGTCPQVGNYLVLASTNVTLPLSQWTPVATNYVGVTNFNNFSATLFNVFHTGPGAQFFALFGPTTINPFTNGEFCTHSQVGWPSDTQATAVIVSNFNIVYGSTFGVLEVGIAGSNGFSMRFDSGAAAVFYMPESGTPGALTVDLFDPITSSSGVFGGDLVALELNVDFSAAGLLSGNFGTLKLCNFTTNGDVTFPGTLTQAQANALNGQTVTQVLAEANTLLGGGTGTYGVTFGQLDSLMQQLNGSFSSCTPGAFAQAHLQRPFKPGEFVTYTQDEWGSDPLSNPAASLLVANYNHVYALSSGIFEIGLPGDGGFWIQITSALHMLDYLPASGPIGVLIRDIQDPSQTEAGQFGGDVAALRLNVDYSAAGLLAGSGIKFGDLKVCNLNILTVLNGKTVTQVLGEAENILGGGTGTFGLNVAQIDAIVLNLNSAFETGLFSLFAQQDLLRP